ncbi:MAG: triose-phosphate isomerase [Chromatiales bacterium]|nr:triose-phosphate isomerase [Chromatiales bacterium]
MRQPLVAGNWKMNGSRASARELLGGVLEGLAATPVACEVAVFVPYVLLQQVSEQLAGSAVTWGAQNLSTEAKGAFTGEISAAMLKEFGSTSVIVGHSERRSLYGETDAVVAKKYQVARAAGLRPIFCIGETLDERESGITNEVVARQIDAVIELEGVAALADGVIAYEPVWAIGTGRTATPEQAQAVHAFIRGRIADRDATVAEGVQILYGGSMNAKNAAELLAQADIDGGLIGGASLIAADFLTICRAA